MAEIVDILYCNFDYSEFMDKIHKDCCCRVALLGWLMKCLMIYNILNQSEFTEQYTLFVEMFYARMRCFMIK